MAWYLRKSFRINKLLRLNLSKSGLGFSVGVKGARVGINSQGKPYTHVGRHGVYARKVYGGRRRADATGVAISNEAIAVAAIMSVLLVVVVGAWGGGIGLFLLLLTSAIWAPVVGLMAFGIIWALEGFAKRINRSAKPPLDIAEQKKRQWQKEPMTQLQEAQISYLFNERELPRTAKYTAATTGLAAFKNAYGRQVTQEEAAGLISFLEGLPIKEIKETHTKNKTMKTPIITIMVVVLIFAAAILVSLTTKPIPEARVTTESKAQEVNTDYKAELGRRAIETARTYIKDGFALEVRNDLRKIPKDSPDYPEAQSIILTITPQMLRRSQERLARETAEHERYVQERQKSKDRLWKQYEWCMGTSRTPWLEHKERAHAYLEFLMKDAYLETHSNLKGWTSKWRP